MRERMIWTKEKLKEFLLYYYPSGNIKARDFNRGLYCAMYRHFGSFREAYEEIYSTPYIDYRTTIDKSGKNCAMYGGKYAKKGKDNGNWKGGIATFRHRLRGSRQYFHWKYNILTRDNFTCRLCGIKTVKLNVHHIKLLNAILDEYNIKTIEDALECDELWFEENGITLCKGCHKKEDWSD